MRHQLSTKGECEKYQIVKMLGDKYEGYRRIGGLSDGAPHTHKFLDKLKYSLWMCLFFGLIVMISYYFVLFFENSVILPINTTSPDEGYLISSPKCKLIDMEPFNEEALKYFKTEPYRACSELQLLTYVKKSDGNSVLHINQTATSDYSTSGITCCYSNVTRPMRSDFGVLYSPCDYFEDSVTIGYDPVMVKCLETTSDKLVYENVHISVIPTETVQQKINSFDKSQKPLSVLLIGIDSVSRLNLIRTMPATHRFLEESHFIPMKGYNKIDDNTFPNLMAILSGLNYSQAAQLCEPTVEGKMDECPMVWHDYRDAGFITAYAEDEASINTFTYLKKGFTEPPTDYYFRPYVIATEDLKESKYKDYCSGPETAGERIMNLARDFSVTFKSHPTFGFFWMNSFSHNLVNEPSGMDDKVKSLLQNLVQEGVTEDSIVVFISDHGIRFGEIRQTLTGWLEERLPFVYVSFPKWFQERFPREVNNFKGNTYKLTTPYDLHMTLQHVLALTDDNYRIRPAMACPLCHSLFQEVDPDRSCSDVNITQHWCTCSGYRNVELQNDLREKVIDFVLGELRDIIDVRNASDICSNYTLSEVISTRMSQPLAHDSRTYIYISLKTEPEAVFEATMKVTGDNKFRLTGSISRLDKYANKSKCVTSNYLQKYCYCLT